MADLSLPSPPTTPDPLDADGGRALVEAWRASGLTGAAYCRMHNIRVARLHYWRERLGYPIRVLDHRRQAQTAPPPTADGFVQVTVKPAASETTAVDIVVGGATVRVMAGFDATLLRAVITALRVEG